uniref:Tn3 family transposase n=1 Tax=Photorhabdus khanii TaxID=1004150 RepID=UPI00195FFA5D|nr:Tn3 family transposase [Photorhabdus khanii]
MVDRHLRAETYASATSVLVDAQQERPSAAIWGDGHISSSDGQFFQQADAAKPASNTTQNTVSGLARRSMAFCRTGLHLFSPE